MAVSNIEQERFERLERCDKLMDEVMQAACIIFDGDEGYKTLEQAHSIIKGRMDRAYAARARQSRGL